jgi:phosphoglucosamine mutase
MSQKTVRKLFGTDGIRGRANEYPITAEVALRIGKAVAHILRSADTARHCVLVGKDPRISGSMLETALTSGLLSMGMDVQLLGTLPTPAIAHLTKSTGAAAGVMITASHNAFEDNGIKIIGSDGYKLTDELECEMENYILGETPEPAPVPPTEMGSVDTLDNARGRYLEHVKQSARDLSLHGMKIVLDCGNGAASTVAPILFRELGAEIIAFSNQPDGLNINDGCGALHPERAAEQVLRHRADLGISLDGDADRVIFTDANGQVVSGDAMLALCAIGLHEQGLLHHQTLVTTVMSNLGLIEAMQEHGIAVATTAVGDRHVIECMRRGGFSFGGENSGHLIFGKYSTTGDGILSALQVLRLMRKRKATLAELAAVMNEYPSLLVNVPVARKPPLDTLPGLCQLMREADEVFGALGRYLIRYSGTERQLRVLVEHRDLETCRKRKSHKKHTAMHAFAPSDCDPLTLTRPLVDFPIGNRALAEHHRLLKAPEGVSLAPHGWMDAADFSAFLRSGLSSVRTTSGVWLAWWDAAEPTDAFFTSQHSFLIRFPWDLLAANERYVSSLTSPQIIGHIHPSAVIEGTLHLGPGSRILPGVFIEGNVIIGSDCKIGPNCYVRGNTSIGDGCHIGQSVEIKNSILLHRTHLGHLSYLGDSVLGENVNFGAGTIVSNLRHDGAHHRSMVGGALVDTGRRKFGCIVGDGVRTGIHTSIYSGRKLWPNTTTRPGDIVQRDILS